ncbi:valine--tRNA ligase [Candidatus Shapirobacteria bacterium]|nr:valine--tRNA ligase [Candidatus Shapirobacteria bacterium]
MDKRYQPQLVEEKIYRFWEEEGFFTPKIEKGKKPFVITLPPPNVTGGLHAGHAMYVIEDIMTRYHRMKGDPTLWLPGFDHAAIAVEYLVNQELKKEGKTKQEIGRGEFLRRAQQFANQSRDYIRQQLKRLGFSLDWSREAYTMDEKRSLAVKTAFNNLYQKGLIYKGDYLVNWCPDCQTVISDLENIYEEEKGVLYYLSYGPITIATTRPETIFADVAVAVHPKDSRFKKLVGQKVPLPLTNRLIPVIIDEAVDQKFGSGALKITPAHDPTDFEVGQRHRLPAPKAVDEKGCLTNLAGPFAGLKVDEGRKRVVEALRQKGFLKKEEPIIHQVGHCQRCGTTTETTISQQWFLKTKPLAQRAIKAVKSGQVKIIPKHFEKSYFHWLENIHDWCISRQLWWGHPLPVKGETDVLDTWFSSSLWPISVFGWPKKTTDLAYFYPTTVRETAYDILFFWVAREMMICQELTGKSPFKIIYLHGLVRDEKGRKFSKTKKIGFDPLEIIEQYGADALRLALVYGTNAGRDLLISADTDRVISMRNFTNKIWNAARFILMNQEAQASSPKTQGKLEILDFKFQNKDDRQILSSLKKTTKSVTKKMENYRFGQAAEELYGFFWHEFCDVYLEQAKKRLYDESDPKGRKETLIVLTFVLKESLKLLHPFMPYVTEEIWTNQLKEPRPLIISSWPRKVTGGH